MKVLLLGPLKSQTGNFSTLQRVRDELADSGIDSNLECISSFMVIPASLAQYISTHNIQCVIGMHAWRAGHLLQGCPVPFALIFGGTDLNELCSEETKLEEMTKAVEQARYLVAFSAPMTNKAITLWPCTKEKIIEQPQAYFWGKLVAYHQVHLPAVVVKPSNFSLKHSVQEVTGVVNKLGSQTLVIFLLVAGLRQVKDPLFLASVISEWHKENSRIHLVIVGPELDKCFSHEVKSVVSGLPGVLLLPAISKRDLHAAIRDSFALVNSSLSEGMSSAILEAMCLNVPVLARNIPGNAAIVSHRETGLLFDTPEEFVTLAQELLDSTVLQERLRTNGKRYVEQHHSVAVERRTYIELVNKLLT